MTKLLKNFFEMKLEKRVSDLKRRVAKIESQNVVRHKRVTKEEILKELKENESLYRF